MGDLSTLRWESSTQWSHRNLIHEGWWVGSAHLEQPAPQHPSADIIHHYIQPSSKPGALIQPPRQPAIHSCTDTFSHNNQTATSLGNTILNSLNAVLYTADGKNKWRANRTFSMLMSTFTTSRFQPCCQPFYHPERWRLSEGEQTLMGSQRQPMQRTPGQSWRTLKTNRRVTTLLNIIGCEIHLQVTLN